MRIKQETAFTGRSFSVALEEHELPDGRRASYHVVHYSPRGAVAVLPLFADGRVGLIQQYRPSVANLVWEIPAGKVEPGETAADCARRELREEIGCQVDQLQPLGRVHNALGMTDAQVQLFAAQVTARDRQQTEDDEFIRLVCVPWDEALAMVKNGVISDSKTILALLLYERERSA